MAADSPDLTRLNDDLTRLTVQALPKVRAIVQRGALNIKRELQAEARGVRHAPGLPSSITFTTTETAGSVTAEIGPEKGHAGSLALLYFGNSRTGARLKDPRFALEREMTAVESFLTRLGEDAL